MQGNKSIHTLKLFSPLNDLTPSVAYIVAESSHSHRESLGPRPVLPKQDFSGGFNAYSLFYALLLLSGCRNPIRNSKTKRETAS